MNLPSPSHPTTAKSMRFINVLLTMMIVLLMLSLALSVFIVAQGAEAARSQSEANNLILQQLETQLDVLECIVEIPPIDRTPTVADECRALVGSG